MENGMNQNNFISCQDMIVSTMFDLEKQLSKDSNKLSSIWKKIITSISMNGQNIYEHSRVIEIKNNILLVEADHPGWIQLLQGHKNYILKGLSMYAKELEINTLAFRLRGSNAILHSVDSKEHYDKAFEKQKKQEDFIDNELKKFSKNSETKSIDLPEDLFAKFESLKKSVLTNSKK